MSTGFRPPDINVVVLAGRLVRDADLTFTPSGTAKCQMRMAVDRNTKDSKTGEWKKEAFFIDVVVWREQAERAKERAKKGAPVIVEGRLAGREYEDKSGQKRAVFEVVANRLQFLSSVTGEASAPAAKKPAGAGAEPAADAGDLEEVPF